VGALQRPRLQGWLARELGDDEWLGQLALEILTWAGVPATAGASLWPLDSWAEHRSQFTGDWSASTTVTVEREVEHVLNAMRTRPAWYQKHVECPLGAKTAPLAPSYAYEGSAAAEFPAMAAVPQHEILDARLADLASVALASIEAQLDGDGALGPTVALVIKTVFGHLDLAAELTASPHDDSAAEERLTALIDDPSELDRIADVVRAILSDITGGNRKIPGSI
jgi:hypothetical protein